MLINNIYPISLNDSLVNHPTDSVIARIRSRELQYPIRIILIGDPWNINPIFTGMLEFITVNHPNTHFITILGDFARGGYLSGYESYLSTIDTFPIPILSVIGNHEQDIPEGLSYFINNFGSPNIYFDYGNYRFITLANCEYSEIPDVWGDYTRYFFADSTLDWFESVLSTPYPEHKVVFMHIPPFLDGSLGVGCIGGWGYLPDREESNTDRFTSLCRQYDVSLVANGHIHSYIRIIPDRALYGDIMYIISGGGGSDLTPYLHNPPHSGSFYHYVAIELSEDGGIFGKLFIYSDGEISRDWAFDFNYTIDVPISQSNEERKPIRINRGNLYDIRGRLIRRDFRVGDKVDLPVGLYFIKETETDRSWKYLHMK